MVQNMGDRLWDQRDLSLIFCFLYLFSERIWQVTWVFWKSRWKQGQGVCPGNGTRQTLLNKKNKTLVQSHVSPLYTCKVLTTCTIHLPIIWLHSLLLCQDLHPKLTLIYFLPFASSAFPTVSILVQSLNILRH